MRRIMLMVTVALVMAAMLALAGVAWAQGTPRPVDPPPQVAELRQQFEGLTPEQVEAEGYAPEGPCVPSPSGVGAMGTHAINRQLYQAQFPNGTMDPANPSVLLLGQDSQVIGLEWEAADVGQGPMELFGQTIELQSGHPGAEEPHYMLHFYFRDGGKVLFGTNDQTAFDPEGICPQMSASASASASPSASAAATSTATATSSASALAQTGGLSPMPVLAAGALALLLTGGLMAAAMVRRISRTASVVLGLALVMALSSCGGGSQETKNPANSTPSIAFMKEDSDGFWQTWVANKDLSDQVKLTSESADSGWAVWKPGGAKLAVDSDRADPDPTDSEAINDIFTMNPDGSGIVKLTHSEDLSGDPGWSPDGSQIAFAADRRNHRERREIYVMDADGSNVRRVTTLPEKAELDTAPRFSPDGRRLVFTRYIIDPGRSALFTVRVDGGGLKQLTPWDNGAGDADWSPDGTKIVFEASPNAGSRGEVFTIDADGQQLTNLTDNDRSGGGSADPVWSPDGTKILFLSEHYFSGESGIGLATMNPDGTDRHFISPNPEEMHQPDWESVP